MQLFCCTKITNFLTLNVSQKSPLTHSTNQQYHEYRTWNIKIKNRTMEYAYTTKNQLTWIAITAIHILMWLKKCAIVVNVHITVIQIDELIGEDIWTKTIIDYFTYWTNFYMHCGYTELTVFPSSKSVMSQPLRAQTKRTARTSSKHWIHFRLSDL